MVLVGVVIVGNHCNGNYYYYVYFGVVDGRFLGSFRCNFYGGLNCPSVRIRTNLHYFRSYG